jgi:hypothetical protein
VYPTVRTFFWLLLVVASYLSALYLLCMRHSEALNKCGFFTGILNNSCEINQRHYHSTRLPVYKKDCTIICDLIRFFSSQPLSQTLKHLMISSQQLCVVVTVEVRHLFYPTSMTELYFNTLTIYDKRHSTFKSV